MGESIPTYEGVDYTGKIYVTNFVGIYNKYFQKKIYRTEDSVTQT